MFNLRSRLASSGFDVHSVTSPAFEFVFVGKEERPAGHDGCSTATGQLKRYSLYKMIVLLNIIFTYLVDDGTAPGLSLCLENRHGVSTNIHYLVGVLSAHDGGRQFLSLLWN